VDTLAQRWARLEPHLTIYGPGDKLSRPAVLLFHGCGGVRPHLTRYAQAAAQAGYRAFVFDSYGARGWSQAFGIGFVCTGSVFRGHERAGDVLAALWGVSRRPDVDASRVALAGWSHGGWGIMELMAAPLEASGEIGLADPEAADLEGIKGLMLIYPYIGVLAPRRSSPWRRRPPTLAVIARHDHLTTVRNAERVWGAVSDSGVEVETWIAEAPHSFDEPLDFPPMRHDAAATVESIERFSRFLRATLGAAPATTVARKA
jgi:dienelactone hydrolase